MAEENTETKERAEGDAMLVATTMLKAPKARTAMKVLPRTIEWENLFLIGALTVVGLIVGAALFKGALQPTLTSGVVAGVLGFILPSLSPLPGESIVTWLGLQVKDTASKRVTINGRRAKMYVGTYPLKRVALGHTRLLPAGGDVKAYEYDERGYPQMTTTKGNSQLAEQRKLRTRANSTNKLRPSTTLEVPAKKSIAGMRKEQQNKAAPRLPRAGEKRSSSVELNKRIKIKQKKDRKRRRK